MNVVAPRVQQAYGGQAPTKEGLLEGYYLGFLGLYFVFILLEGLFIALSVRPRQHACLSQLLSPCMLPCRVSLAPSVTLACHCRGSCQKVQTNLHKT